jgi:hypothetical protein
MRTTNQTEKSRIDDSRPKRVPINGGRDILTVKGIPEDLHACWVNDYNVERYQAAGYSFWTGSAVVGDNKVDNASSLTDSVVSKAVGNGVTAFVMVIPKDLYDEDQKAMAQEVKEKEAILFRQQKQGEGRYGDIKVQTGNDSVAY